MDRLCDRVRVSNHASDVRLRRQANRTCARRGRARGFTLVELVMVILLLGIMATFTSQFIGIGSQIYGDASSREQLMSDARFAMERLNREVRDAVPGSERIETQDGLWTDEGPCLRFWPISTSSRYLALNRPVSAGSMPFELVMAAPLVAVEPGKDWLVVFPVPEPGLDSLRDGCAYGRCTALVGSVGNLVSGAQTVGYQGELDGLSPGSRVYFAREQVRYCAEGGALYRATSVLSGASSTMPLGTLMAESLRTGSFYRETSAFNAEGEFGMRFVFERKGESVTFNHKIEVFNVP
ncbi:PilW family protein [Aeromonas salmonicida]|uniref:PilW family protein n=1 Tax=Aeromonas salmonicida TaxID=645 RepID=UPI0012D86CF0|nr:type II secretion system protein [Aeromonas salmonicida]MUG27273.1 type II secretion system protein [Aeromonas salmonicida]